MALQKDKLPILEQFVSVQGEGVNIGKPYYFIRVGGCPLRCNFCDSEYSWVARASTLLEVNKVVANAINACKQNNIEWVSITGGEPLLYPDQLIAMISVLNAVGIKTHIETSGRYYNAAVHEMCTLYSPDAKTPCTGEHMDGFFKGLDKMRPQDQVKCLIMNDNDMNYAHMVNKALNGRCAMVLQPFNSNIYTNSTVNMNADMRNGKPSDNVPLPDLRNNISETLRWLLMAYQLRTTNGEVWKNVVITPQIHVLAYGNQPSR